MLTVPATEGPHAIVRLREMRAPRYLQQRLSVQAVNLSARQFRRLCLASLVEDSLRENVIDPSQLAIELTESLLMEDNEGTRAMLESFAHIGVRLAIGDFGTGHSSLSDRKRFRIVTQKIDRSFVRSLPDDADDVAIATAVIALGRSMGMKLDLGLIPPGGPLAHWTGS